VIGTIDAVNTIQIYIDGVAKISGGSKILSYLPPAVDRNLNFIGKGIKLN
jgi:hypothetical protein